MGLQFKRNVDSEPLVEFVNADWASDMEAHKSVTVSLFKVYGSKVSWVSRRRHPTDSIFPNEAEYVALGVVYPKPSS